MSECSICIETFSTLEDLAVLPCGHCFHGNCIETWGRTPQITGPCCPICHGKFRLEQPRGVVRKIFMSGMQLIKTEALKSLQSLRSLLDTAVLKAKEKVEERDVSLKNAEERIEAVKKELVDERERGKSRGQYLRVVEERNEKMSRRFLELEEKLAAERESKKEAIELHEENVKCIRDELSQKEAEFTVAEFENLELTKSLEALGKEIEQRGKQAEEKNAETIKEMEEDIERKREEIRRKREEIKRKEEGITRKEEEILRKEEEILRKEEEILRKEEEILRKEEEILRKEEKIREKEEDIEGKEEENKRKEEETKRKDDDMENRVKQLRKTVRQHRELIDSSEALFSQERQKFAQERKEREEEEMRWREKLDESDDRCENLATQLRFLKDPIRIMVAQMEDISAVVVRCQELFHSQRSGFASLSLTDGKSLSNGGESVCEGDAPSHNGGGGGGGVLAVDALDLFIDLEAGKEATALHQMEGVRTRDAAFIGRLGMELVVEIDPSSRDSSEDVSLLEERIDGLRLSPLSASDLNHLVDVLSGLIDTPYFNYFVRTLIDDLSSTLIEIFEYVPVIEIAVEEARVGLIASGLRLTAYLLLGRVDDVKVMLRRRNLVDSLSRHLRFDVDILSGVKILALTALRIAVCRPTLCYDWFPSVSLLRSLLLGPKDVQTAASRFLHDSIECGRACSSVIAQLRKENLIGGQNSTLLEAAQTEVKRLDT